MIRTQIQLSEVDFDRVRREAANRKCSIAAFVRQSVKLALADAEADALRAKARGSVGRYRSGVADLSRNHDAHLESGW